MQNVKQTRSNGENEQELRMVTLLSKASEDPDNHKML